MVNNNLFPAKFKLSFLIAVSFAIGLVLAVIPLPSWANLLRPEWIVLLLLYWLLTVPNKIGIFWAWLIGLLLDSLFDIPLGVFAISLVLIAYLIISLRIRFDIFSFSQKLAFVCGFMFLYQLPYFVFEFSVGNSFSIWLFLLPPLVSTLIWPYFTFFMNTWCDHRQRAEDR